MFSHQVTIKLAWCLSDLPAVSNHLTPFYYFITAIINKVPLLDSHPSWISKELFFRE